MYKHPLIASEKEKWIFRQDPYAQKCPKITMKKNNKISYKSQVTRENLDFKHSMSMCVSTCLTCPHRFATGLQALWTHGKDLTKG
jgi:hypothetical protein